MVNWYRIFIPKETPTHPLKKIDDKRLGVDYFFDWLDG